MRILRILPLCLVCALIWLLNRPLGSLPALGSIIDPINGALAAAEPVSKDFSGKTTLHGLQGPVSIWMEDRLVPHIQASNEHDLYYAQGFVHASFRLWQMDIQTRAAGGRVSEVAGSKAIEFDRGQRRKGMVWGAEHSLQAMEAEPRTKAMLDAYRDGINAYIHSLNQKRLPVEYKLMGFYPEDWTNLRSALLLKYMADDLTGKTDDIAYSQLRDQLGQQQFDFLFPEKIAGSKPVIPEHTPFPAASLPTPKYPGDQVWAHFTSHSANSISMSERSGQDEAGAGIGSNNWAISSKFSSSGKSILCNDPHLGLNLPSLWFEMQLSAPGVNAYGASLPGAPGIVIGFNDKISWGFTNNYRDVKDFYEIKDQAEAGQRSYWFCGTWRPYEVHVEQIRVKGGADYLDTVLYTVHGPVMYEPKFPDEAKSGKMLACTWMGHRGTNELLAIYQLNRAANYEQFVQAIANFKCPAQNFVYADGAGNIAMWGQGQFINKWKGQGRFVMEGQDSLSLWGQDIPMGENPHVLNPEQGYLVSANQAVTDSTYPYYYNGNFTEWRSWEIHYMLLEGFLHEKDSALYRQLIYSNKEILFPSTVCRGSGYKAPELSAENMKGIQNTLFSLLNFNLTTDIRTQAEFVDAGKLLKSYFQHDTDLDDVLKYKSQEATAIQIWWNRLYTDIWQDDFPNSSKWPSSERTIQLLLKDSVSPYYDDKRTAQVEGLQDIIHKAFQETRDSLEKIKKTGWEWYKVKNTSLTHLAKIPAFSYTQLPIGGWSNTINACSGNHGPSWRMIVEMDSIPKGYAIYPGGQSGNPGSIHYGEYIDNWVKGNYYEMHFLKMGILTNPFKYQWELLPG